MAEILPDLRDATLSDVDNIMDLYEAAMVPVWKRYGRDYDLARVRENIRGRLGTDDYFLWILPEGHPDDGAGLRAYMAWEVHRDHTSGHRIAHLRMIMVRPGHRGNGIASALVEEFENRARSLGCTKVLFDVLKGSPANTFYEKQGFRHWSNYMEKHL